MATIVTKSIGTNNRDYSTLAAWIAACPANLVNADQVWKGEMYADSTFTDGCFINIPVGNTDGSRYVWLTVAAGQRHNGTASGGGVVIDLGGAASINTHIIGVRAQYTVIEWLRITNWIAPDYATSGGITNFNGGEYNQCGNCIIHNATARAGSYSTVNGILGYNPGTYVYNCLAYNINSAPAAGASQGILVDYGSAARNCTVYNCQRGIIVADSSTATDCISMANNNYDFALISASISYCMSSDATAVGTGCLVNQTTANVFTSVTGGSENFALKPDSPAIGVGTNLSAEFKFDIRGFNRNSSWDMGAFRYTEVLARSIGTKTPYNTGTISVSGTTLTLTGGTFDANWGEGDCIVVGGAFSDAFSDAFDNGAIAYVKSRTDATHLELQTYPSSTISGASYTIQRAYSTLPAWQAAVPTSLVAADMVYKGIGYNDSLFVGGPSFNNITCDPTRYVWCTAAPGHRHSGRAYTTSGVRCEPTAIYTDSRDRGFGFSTCPYALVEWWQVNAVNGPRASLMSAFNTSAENPTFRNNIIYAPNQFSQQFGGAIDATGSGAKIYNNLIYGKFQRGIFPSYGPAVYNNTIVLTNPLSNFAYSPYHSVGIDGATGSNTIKNNMVFVADPSGVCFAGGTTVSNNMSSDATAPGSGSLINKVASNQFVCVTAGNEDFTLRQTGDAVVGGVTSEAIGAGANLSSIFDTDNRSITTRGATWDMGARQHSTIITKSIGTNSRDYSTITAWNAAVPANLLTSGQIWKGTCYKDGDFAAATLSTGARTTDADSYMWITTAAGQRHAGKKGTGARIDAATAATGITISSQYAVVDGLEVRNFATNGIYVNTYTVGNSYARIFNNLVYEGVGGIGGSSRGIGSISGDGAFNDYIYNNIVYACGIGIISYSVNWGIFVINNSITGCNYGFQISASVNHITINNIIVGNNYNYYTTSTTSTFWVGGRNAYESDTSKWYSASPYSRGLFQKFSDAVIIGTCTINTGTKTITWVSGPDYSTLNVGDKVTVGSTYIANEYTIATKTDNTHLIVSETMTTDGGTIAFVAKTYNIDTTASACFKNITVGSEDLNLKATAPVLGLGYGPSSSWYNAGFQAFALGANYYLNGTYPPPTKDAVSTARSFPSDLGALLYFNSFNPAWANRSTMILSNPILGGSY